MVFIFVCTMLILVRVHTSVKSASFYWLPFFKTTNVSDGHINNVCICMWRSHKNYCPVYLPLDVRWALKKLTFLLDIGVDVSGFLFSLNNRRRTTGVSWHTSLSQVLVTSEPTFSFRFFCKAFRRINSARVIGLNGRRLFDIVLQHIMQNSNNASLVVKITSSASRLGKITKVVLK